MMAYQYEKENNGGNEARSEANESEKMALAWRRRSVWRGEKRRWRKHQMAHLNNQWP